MTFNTRDQNARRRESHELGDRYEESPAFYEYGHIEVPAAEQLHREIYVTLWFDENERRQPWITIDDGFHVIEIETVQLGLVIQALDHAADQLWDPSGWMRGPRPRP